MIDEKKYNAVIIMPSYEDTKSVDALLGEIKKLEHSFYIIIIDDGSVYETYDKMLLSKHNLHGEIIKLSVNVGHQKAIYIGLRDVYENVSDDMPIIVMDSDGEDDPNVISNLLELYKKNKNPIVVSRSSRQENITFRLFYFFYKLFFKALTGKNLNFGNFSLINKIVLKLLFSKERLIVHYAAGILLSIKNITRFPCPKQKRLFGQSKMNFQNLVMHGVHGLLVFSHIICLRVSIFSFCIMIFIVSMMAIAVILKILGFATPGWFSLAFGILTLLAIQFAILSFLTLLFIGSNSPKEKIQIEFDKEVI